MTRRRTLPLFLAITEGHDGTDAILGLLPLLVLNMPGTEIERPLAIVMIGGLVTSTLFTLLALPTFYLFVHDLGERMARRRTAEA